MPAINLHDCRSIDNRAASNDLSHSRMANRSEMEAHREKIISSVEHHSFRGARDTDLHHACNALQSGETQPRGFAAINRELSFTESPREVSSD